MCSYTYTHAQRVSVRRSISCTKCWAVIVVILWFRTHFSSPHVCMYIPPRPTCILLTVDVYRFSSIPVDKSQKLHCWGGVAFHYSQFPMRFQRSLTGPPHRPPSHSHYYPTCPLVLYCHELGAWFRLGTDTLVYSMIYLVIVRMGKVLIGRGWTGNKCEGNQFTEVCCTDGSTLIWVSCFLHCFFLWCNPLSFSYQMGNICKLHCDILTNFYRTTLNSSSTWVIRECQGRSEKSVTI